jgi:hypothetical protein
MTLRGIGGLEEEIRWLRANLISGILVQVHAALTPCWCRGVLGELVGMPGRSDAM